VNPCTPLQGDSLCAISYTYSNEPYNSSALPSRLIFIACASRLLFQHTANTDPAIPTTASCYKLACYL